MESRIKQKFTPHASHAFAVHNFLGYTVEPVCSVSVHMAVLEHHTVIREQHLFREYLVMNTQRTFLCHVSNSQQQ